MDCTELTEVMSSPNLELPRRVNLGIKLKIRLFSRGCTQKQDLRKDIFVEMRKRSRVLQNLVKNLVSSCGGALSDNTKIGCV